MNIYDNAAVLADGGAVVSKAVVASAYQIRPEIATADYAAAVVAMRFRLRIETAREVCRMAGIGAGQ